MTNVEAERVLAGSIARANLALVAQARPRQPAAVGLLELIARLRIVERIREVREEIQPVLGHEC